MLIIGDAGEDVTNEVFGEGVKAFPYSPHDEFLAELHKFPKEAPPRASGTSL